MFEVDPIILIRAYNYKTLKKIQFGCVLGLLFILEIINMTRSSILVCQDFGFLPSSSRSFLHQLLFSLLNLLNLFSFSSSLEQSGVGVLLLLPLLWKERQSKIENISIQIYIVCSCTFCSSSFCLLLLSFTKSTSSTAQHIFLLFYCHSTCIFSFLIDQNLFFHHHHHFLYTKSTEYFTLFSSFLQKKHLSPWPPLPLLTPDSLPTGAVSLPHLSHALASSARKFRDDYAILHLFCNFIIVLSRSIFCHAFTLSDNPFGVDNISILNQVGIEMKF